MTSPSLHVERERIIQALCSHYANDHLTTQELEARFDLAYKAASAEELQALVASLPALPASALLPPTPRRDVSPRDVAPYASVEAEKRSVVVMSEMKKRGEWIPARRNTIRAVMASVELDLREALLSQGEIEFDLKTMMAEVIVIVPPGLRVVCDGSAFMGEFTELHASGREDPGAPVVRVTGFAFMATVSVETRLPGESKRDARRREKLEQKARRPGP